MAEEHSIEIKLEKMGLVLPAPLLAPVGTNLSFALVRVWGEQAYISGHAAQNSAGSLAGPFGRVGADLSLEQGYQAARGAAISVLASLKQELGDLDRIIGWLKVLGLVNSAPEFQQQTRVIFGANLGVVWSGARQACAIGYRRSRAAFRYRR